MGGQTWVDNEGNYWTFRGRFEGDWMILPTEDVVEGKSILLHMVFFNIKSDEMDWDWGPSKDGDRSWDLR